MLIQNREVISKHEIVSPRENAANFEVKRLAPINIGKMIQIAIFSLLIRSSLGG